MKNLRNLFTALLLLCCGIATAEDFEVDGVYYNITDETNKTVEVSWGSYTGDVVIPKSVTCNNVTYSVTSIGRWAFQGCSGLTSITIPNSVTSIGDWAFEGCSGLTSVTIPNGVTSIGDDAFWGCSGLESITIPNSVTSIGNSAFEGTAWYNNQPNGLLYLDGWLLGYKGDAPTGSIVIADGTKGIGGDAFSSCSGLTSVTIGNSVTSIGNWAFENCSGLTSITIPNSVTSIGYCAFYNCSGLTSVTIGNGVTSIGYCAFYNCSGLTSITIPNSVTSIGYCAFYNCSELTSITIPNSVTSIISWAFEGCSGLKTVINLSNLTFTKGSTDYGYVAYYADKVINAPNGVVNGDYIFSTVDGKHSLAGYLGSEENITLPSNYNGANYAIGEKAFEGNTLLRSVTIPNGVTRIGERAFYGCRKAETLYIGNSVTSIGNEAFYGCEGLLEIKSASKMALICSTNIFSENTYNNACLYVPEGRKFAYEKAQPWNKFYILEFNFTGIEDVVSESNDDRAKSKTVYDLNGHRILDKESLTRGLYIINGNKVLVK